VLEQGEDDRVIVAQPEKCTACRWCELHCPDFAIFVSDLEPPEEVGIEDGSASRPGSTASEEENA
jgi:2-oxoglutarate ferredoxin oxidoreductase subunit delta